MLKGSSGEPFRTVVGGAILLVAGAAGCGNGSANGQGAGSGGASGGALGGASGVAGALAGMGGTATVAGSGQSGSAGAAGSAGSGGGAGAAAGAAGAFGMGGSAGGGMGGTGGGAATAGASGSGAGAGQGGAGGAAGVAGDGGGGAGGSSGASAGTAGSAGATTCTGSTLAAGDSNRTVMVGGVARTYILHVPSGYTGKTAVPLVLDFHGLGGSGMQQEGSSGFRQVSDREGFLVAFPNGIDNAWNIGPCCTNSRDVDDLGFAKSMVQSISADGCVDAKRVYSAGFSMGGGMSHFLACNAADVFAAVAPSSFDLLVPDEQPCAPSRPISVIAFRGTADTVVPFAGGQGSSGRVTFLGAQGSFDRWAGIDGCVEPTTADGDCTYYEHCDQSVEVGLCVKQGGSHAPGDATVGWAFLSRFSLP